MGEFVEQVFEYQLWHGVSDLFRRWEPGRLMVKGWAGSVSVPLDGGRLWEKACERVFRLHNADGRPDGAFAPSLCVGDVVQFGELAYAVDPVGWRRINLHEAVIVPGRWDQVVANGL